MRKSFYCLICLLLVSTLLSSCMVTSKPNDESQQETMLYERIGVPAIAEFSGTEYSSRVPPVESAIYRYNGKEESIAVDDPRLVRLLNFLVHSLNEGSTWLIQGIIEEEDINTYLASEKAMLDITFLPAEDPDAPYIKTPRLVVCGDNYLEFLYPEPYNREPGTLIAEHHWPYGEQAFEAQRKGILANASLGEVSGDDWIDLLEYAGF